MKLNEVLNQKCSLSTIDLLFEASSELVNDQDRSTLMNESLWDRITGKKSFDYDEQDFQSLGYLKEAIDNNDFGLLIGKPGTRVFQEEDIDEIKTEIRNIIYNNSLVDGDSVENLTALSSTFYSVFNIASSTILAGVAAYISKLAVDYGLSAFNIADVFKSVLDSASSQLGELGGGIISHLGIPSILGTGLHSLGNAVGVGLIGAGVGAAVISLLNAAGAYRQARVLRRLRTASKTIAAADLLSSADLKNINQTDIDEEEREYFERLMEKDPKEAEQWYQQVLEEKALAVRDQFDSIFDDLPDSIPYRTKDGEGGIKRYPTEQLFDIG